MDTNMNKKNILNLLDNVELEILQKNTEYAKKFLEEEGFNTLEELKFAGEYMKKIKFLSKAVANKKQDLTLMEKALIHLKKAIDENINQTTDVLISLLKTKSPKLQYRKLENWSDDEIRDVLADVDLLKLMEELENLEE
tara:strand:- start:146 stop:562 length:417 start_codon:yes stop_codon:yes gene_type:complete